MLLCSPIANGKNFRYFLSFLCGSRICFAEFYRRKDENRIGGTTKSSAFEKAYSRWKYSIYSRAGTAELNREKILQKTLVYIISLLLCQLYGEENVICDRSVEVHLKNPETTRDAYLGLVLSIYIKNSSIHLVTQSL